MRNPALNFMQVWPARRRHLDNWRLLQCQTDDLLQKTALTTYPRATNTSLGALDDLIQLLSLKRSRSGAVRPALPTYMITYCQAATQAHDHFQCEVELTGEACLSWKADLRLIEQAQRPLLDLVLELNGKLPHLDVWVPDPAVAGSKSLLEALLDLLTVLEGNPNFVVGQLMNF